MTFDDGVLERILAALAEALNAPTGDLPSTRLFVRARLVRLLVALRKKLELPGSLTGRKMLEDLIRSRVVAEVHLDGVAERFKPDRFVTVGWGEDPSVLNPLELLQVHEREGTACYFSALMVHELTTQTIAHHHIAVRRKSPAGESVGKTVFREGADDAPPLGDWQFTFLGTPYYKTAREPRYLVEDQHRELSSRSWCRVTTIEQTLIDTMHRPMSCGGPAVVFEAWEHAAARVRADRMLRLLRVIGDHRLVRRVGYMMYQSAMPAVNEVQALAAELGANNAPPVPLFGGIPYSTVDQRWNLRAP